MYLVKSSNYRINYNSIIEEVIILLVEFKQMNLRDLLPIQNGSMM